MKTPLFIRKLTARVPQVTDVVWWASKQIEAVVISVGSEGFRFEGGEPVENKIGKRVPRWTVTTNYDSAIWDDSLHCWIVGQGKYPTVLHGAIVKPEPVTMTGAT